MPKTINYTNNGDSTATLTMTWTALKTKLDSLGSDAGEYFYERRWKIGELTWEQLTNQQKLNVLLQEVTYHLRQGAYAQYADDTVQAAKDSMESETEKYNMED